MESKVKRYRKPEAVKHLEDLAFAHKIAKYPNFPYPVKTKYRDDTANGLTKCIISFIQLKGGQAERISNTGRNYKGKWIYGTGTNGTADISATIQGKSVKIEIKIGKDRQSEAQKQYQTMIERAGGIYVIAKDFTGFLEWFNLKFGSNGNLEK